MSRITKDLLFTKKKNTLTLKHLTCPFLTGLLNLSNHIFNLETKFDETFS